MQTVERTIAAEIDSLEEVFHFRQPDDVRAYLTANPDLLPLVREAAAQLRAFLPGDGRLVLEVLWDVDDEDDPGELFALFLTTLEPDAVRPALNRLTWDWLVQARRPAVGRFNVNVEYH